MPTDTTEIHPVAVTPEVDMPPPVNVRLGEQSYTLLFGLLLNELTKRCSIFVAQADSSDLEFHQ